MKRIHPRKAGVSPAASETTDKNLSHTDTCLCVYFSYIYGMVNSEGGKNTYFYQPRIFGKVRTRVHVLLQVQI